MVAKGVHEGLDSGCQADLLTRVNGRLNVLPRSQSTSPYNYPQIHVTFTSIQSPIESPPNSQESIPGLPYCLTIKALP